MSKTKLNEFHKAYIEKYIGQKSAKEMAKVMDGIGEKTVQKYINEIKLLKENLAVSLDTFEESNAKNTDSEEEKVPIAVLAKAQLDIMNAKKGVTIMTNEASQIVDEERKVIPKKTDWRGKVATISHDRRKPKNVIVD